MICAGDSLPDGGTTQVDIAIVGAGAVGVALALRLAGNGRRIALIEAGGTQFKQAHNRKYFKAAQVTDARHPPTELYRRRMLGGTTSVWGGRCIPLDPDDFIATPLRGGWPIPFAEVNARMAEALTFLDAGTAEFSATAALASLPMPPDQAATELDLDRIERFSKPTNVWRKWRATLDRSHEVIVIHGATCTNVTTNPEGTRATGLEFRTETNRSHRIAAPIVVLSSGGLETPRLLLASRGSRSGGLGNEHDLVGRFYMTHLVGTVGELSFATPETARAFDYGRTEDGVYGRRLIQLSAEARRREGIGNIVFRPSIPPIDDPSHRDAVLSAMFLAKGLIIPEYVRRLAAAPGRARSASIWRDHGVSVMRGLPRLCGFGANWMRRRVLAKRKLPSVFLYRADGTYPLEFNAEQLPDPDSRVRLSEETDPFGMPRLVVQWQTSEAELDAIARAFLTLATAVSNSRLGAVRLANDLPDAVRSAVAAQGGHHIGTARMGSDPTNSVVDRNGEVWGTKGLFVMGTAIFPTSGFANPTLTAVALAIRLAEHLGRATSGQAVVQQCKDISSTSTGPRSFQKV